MREKKFERFKRNLTTPFKVIVYNEKTLAQSGSFILTRLKVYMTLLASIILLIAMLILSFIYTPVNRLLPAYANSEMQQQIILNVKRTDSLEEQIKIRDTYLTNIKKIISGSDAVIPDLAKKPGELNDETSTMSEDHDSILLSKIEEDEKFNIPLTFSENKLDFSQVHLFAPVKGIITNRFDLNNRHFGIDIVATPNEPILAILEGTVILATWTLATGFVIEIQHDNNLISSYKHNSALLKQAGDHVRAGESIAIIGNTGELSTGPHLHLEVWHNGTPLNPEDYIVF